ncbi:MAG: tRNA (adenosine(37)-N6)-threonylcarbamoyltransferase complex dimerization subunit type 1 TsaB [Rickettsiales bacterium]|nr:tRNA (adenosine(37)-N6)-threonylcarbamoyltransferase complex dimerization subunit type 1 TsaB [Rickettsiales bacterium]
MSTQPILAFDCATVGASIALRVQGNTTTRQIGQTAQAAQLLPAIASLMEEARVGYAELDSIITTIGPGSFTGVRIGLAALHGLVLVSQTPIKTLTTLQAMAWAVARKPHAPRHFWIALRAGKGELYAQKFIADAGVPVADSAITLLPETFTAWDAPCYANHVNMNDPCFIHGPDGATMCAITEYLPATTLAEALPLYIRAPDAIAAAPHAWLPLN